MDEMWPGSDEARREACRAAGVEPGHHCCLDMAFAISRPVLVPHQGFNRIIEWLAVWDEPHVPGPRSAQPKDRPARRRRSASRSPRPDGTSR
jgi:hypothetical protein